MKALILSFFFYCTYQEGFLIVHTNSKEFYEKSLGTSSCLIQTGYYNRIEGVEYVLYFRQNCQEDSILNEIK